LKPHWALGVAIAAALGVSAQKTSRPALFTEAQAKAGATLYHEQCGTCHADDLSGGMGPALKGDAFWNSWDKKSARSLYGRILTSMPAGDPGSLSEKEVLYILAYMFQGNDYPAGDKPLDSAAQLDNVTLERTK
jgi:mono/diheme cytochrome c family protein